MGDILKEIKELQESNEQLKEENEDLREQLNTTCDDDPSVSAFKVGKKYYFRTVTYHATGKVKSIKGNFLVLTDAAWIADSGRFNEAIAKGVLSEVEPVDVNMYININSITDAFDWTHKLPREVK